MPSLFDDFFGPAPLPRIPGLSWHANWIDASAERALLDAVDRGPWRQTWQRRTQHYGFSYPEGGSRFAVPQPLGPLPAWLAPLAQRLADERLFHRAAQNVVVNEYLPGQGIAPHLDLPAYGPAVASLSLGSGVVMDLAAVDGSARHVIWLAPRSLLVLDGEARTEWMHGIARRRSDVWEGERRPRARRVSITFRTVLP